jgi:hypothetical protein
MPHSVKHGARSVMSWAAISSILLLLYLTLNDRITAGDYVDIFGNQVHPLVLVLFPNNDAVFQDNDLPIHSRKCHSWFEERKDALQHLLWPEHSPTLNIIKPLWLVLESRVISRFPPLSLKQLE